MNLSERFLEHRLIFHLGNPSQDVMNSSQNQIQNHLNLNWRIYFLLSSLPSCLGPAQHSLSSPSFCTNPTSYRSPIEPPLSLPSLASCLQPTRAAAVAQQPWPISHPIGPRVRACWPSRKLPQPQALARAGAPSATAARTPVPLHPRPDRAPWLRCP